MLLLLIQSGCAWRTTVLRFRSPSGSRSVEIQKPPNWTSRDARIVLVTGNSEKLLGTVSGKQFLHFVHCWWSPGEDQFALFAPFVLDDDFVYDLRAGEAIEDTKHAMDEMVYDIARSYQLPSLNQRDVWAWAWTKPGRIAFRERYPDFNSE